MNRAVSRWPDLPTDVLSAIADRLDDGGTIGILRLRSVCTSWRSSLSLSPSSIIQFPLNLPSPFPTSPQPQPHLSLSLRPIYLLSPPGGDPSNAFLLKLDHTNPNPNTFALLNPLSLHKPPFKPHSPLNLLDYGVSMISKSYVLQHADAATPSPFKKVVAASNFFANGDFVVLGLTHTGGLLIWRVGDESWTEIVTNGRCFDDIITYKGKFYATADRKGRLVMIDSRLNPVDMVHSLMYGCGFCTHLVACDENLYLVDAVPNNDQGLGFGFAFGVFKLDEKCRFWDYELTLNDSVFFIGTDVNFSLSKKDYHGGVRNCVFFLNPIFYGEGDSKFTIVFDMKKGRIRSLVDCEKYVRLYWPPSSWFL